jgi:hypothetical protein
MIGSRFLNFEDEISLRGVECNIPPVSIGIVPVNRPREFILEENIMENIHYVISAYYGLSIRGVYNTLKSRVFW